MPGAVHELVATEVALAKLAPVTSRPQRPGSCFVTVMVGNTDRGRVLTLVIARTLDPATWLIVMGWSAMDAERNL